MLDKQLQIPGLELPTNPLLMSYNPRRKNNGWPADRIAFLEKRIAALELELSLLKIQMEVDCA